MLLCRCVKALRSCVEPLKCNLAVMIVTFKMSPMVLSAVELASKLRACIN